MQENDISQINFIKYNMQKFAHIMGKVGEDKLDRTQSMHDCSQMINADTDVKIFIEYNKSSNLTVSKESFEDFEQTAEEKSLARSAAASQVSNSAFIIDDNYMAKSGTNRMANEEMKVPRNNSVVTKRAG